MTIVVFRINGIGKIAISLQIMLRSAARAVPRYGARAEAPGSACRVSGWWEGAALGAHVRYADDVLIAIFSWIHVSTVLTILIISRQIYSPSWSTPAIFACLLQPVSSCVM